MQTLLNCPNCQHTHFDDFLTCKDYTVSKKSFHIVSCQKCEFKFTNPIPELNDLGNYYKSEEYISHSNTKAGIVSKLYHLVRSYTLGKKIKLLKKYVKPGLILDYGAGTGMFLNACENSGWKGIGMEPDSDARAIAKGMGLTLLENKGGIDVLLPNQTFDAITLWHVLEHVTDLDDTLKYFKKKLNSNGALIIAVPNYTSEDAKHYKEFWAAYDVPRHLYHFAPNSISRLLSTHGFKLINTHPMKFDSFYVSMLSEKYKTGKVNYLNAFYNGLRSNLKARSASNYSSVIYVFKHA